MEANSDRAERGTFCILKDDWTAKEYVRRIATQLAANYERGTNRRKRAEVERLLAFQYWLRARVRLDPKGVPIVRIARERRSRKTKTA